MKLSESAGRKAKDYSDILKDAETKIDEYLEAGEIINPEYQELKNKVNRYIDAQYEHDVQEPYMWGRGNVHDKKSDAFQDVIGQLVMGATNVPPLKKKVDKVKGDEANDPLIKAVKAYCDKYMPLVEKLKALKGIVVKMAKKREEKKAAVEAETKVKFTNSSSLVKVLEAHRKEYVDRAGEMAADQYDSWMKDLEKHDWLLSKMVPADRSLNHWSKEYTIKKNRQAFLSSITEPVKSEASHSSADLTHFGYYDHRKPSKKAKDRWIKDSREGADQSYHRWILKMVDKIGEPVEHAEMSGDPWTNSVIKVITKSGNKQTWNTKMIINRSVYDKLFNQFPSRRQD